jgi:F-type H+-transporting ATPase subunit a
MNNNLIKYSPYLITIFVIILLLNILGLIPFVKSLTSTLSITFFFSISGFLGLNIQGALIHKLFFFNKFAPNGVPFLILPALVIIELISYFMRPISLAIRLFANMLAGHILIKLFITFCLDLSGVSIILFFGCFCFICILMSLEVFISFLQAYIFTLLILLYINDVLNNQH